MAGMCSLWPEDLEAGLMQKELAKMASGELLLETSSVDSPLISAAVPLLCRSWPPFYLPLSPIFASPSHPLPACVSLALTHVLDVLCLLQRRRVITYQSDFNSIVCLFENSFKPSELAELDSEAYRG